jgi:CRP-like cAMP-binding protein
MARLSERDWEGLVEAHPELAALPAELRRHAEQVAVAAGQSVFRLGARPSRILWVLEGEIRLVRRSRNGAEIVLQRARSGFVAEASLESSRYHCDALAATDSRLLALPIEPFRQALRQDEAFRAFWMARLAREVRLLRSQCERLALRSASERIEHYIEAEGRDGRLELPRTRKAWAAELGLSHEALYRALASLQRCGRISALERQGVLTLTLKARQAVK